MRTRKQVAHRILRAVRVLVFVNVDIAPPLLAHLPHLLLLGEQKRCLLKQVVKIQGFFLRKSPFVFPPHSGDDARKIIVSRARLKLVSRYHISFLTADCREHLPRLKTFWANPCPFHSFFERGERISAVKNRKPRRNADCAPLPAQNVNSQGVKSAYPRRVCQLGSL